MTNEELARSIHSFFILHSKFEIRNSKFELPPPLNYAPPVKPYITLARPFTLLPPLLGIVSGAVCAWGSAHNPDPSRAVTSSVVMTIVLGSACAAFLNAANNSLNQIYDLEIDRIN